jgi:hypothetical protein
MGPCVFARVQPWTSILLPMPPLTFFWEASNLHPPDHPGMHHHVWLRKIILEVVLRMYSRKFIIDAHPYNLF